MRIAYLVPMTIVALAPLFAMDAGRGAQVVRDQNCLECHNLAGAGGREARDLADRLVDDYTSASVAATLWNHMPQMWAAMEDADNRPRPSEQDAEDLFAYLYSLRFFDRAGQFDRGETAFESKDCAGCHSMGTPAIGPGPPISLWDDVVEDPFFLVQEMWNHSPQMLRAARERDVEWKSLNARDLADITAFVQQVQGRTPSRVAPRLSLPDAGPGRELFESKCGSCHPTQVALEQRLRNKTLTDIAAGIWNHLPRMEAAPLVEPGEMRSIVAYLWQTAYDQPPGDSMRGGRVFEEKRCAACHDSSVAPRITRGQATFTPFTLISRWFEHGPAMEQAMREAQIRWPDLSERDVADLVAYLNTLP